MTIDLSQRDWAICARVVRGETQASVARAYGISRERVWQILRAPVRPPRVRAPVRVVVPRPPRVPKPTPEERARRAQLAKCATQLRMATALFAMRAVRNGAPAATVAEITGVVVPDPFAPLVPYARAMLTLAMKHPERAPVPAVDPVSA